VRTDILIQLARIINKLEKHVESNEAISPAPRRSPGFDIGERAAELASRHGLIPEVRDAIAAALAEAVGTRFKPGPEVGLLERVAAIEGLTPQTQGCVAEALADAYGAGLDRQLRETAATWRVEDTQFAILHEEGYGGYRMHPVSENVDDVRFVHAFHARGLADATNIMTGFLAGVAEGRASALAAGDDEPIPEGKMPGPISVVTAVRLCESLRDWCVAIGRRDDLARLAADGAAGDPAAMAAVLAALRPDRQAGSIEPEPMLSIGARGAPAAIVMGTFVVMSAWFLIQIILAILHR
jgi:hypothetical protein